MGKSPTDDVKRQESDALEREIDSLRQRTQDLIAELEHRVDRVKDRVEAVKDRAMQVKDFAKNVPAQLRAHPKTVAGVSTGTLALAGLGIWLFIRRRIEERRFSNRMLHRARGYRALLADPHRALHAREPIGKRLLAAVLVAGATTIVRSLSLLLVKRTVEPRMLPPAPRMLPSRNGSTTRE